MHAETAVSICQHTIGFRFSLLATQTCKCRTFARMHQRHLSSLSADTPTMDGLKEGKPDRWRLVKAHGTAVGLPTDDDMGNSEVLVAGDTNSCPKHAPAAQHVP